MSTLGDEYPKQQARLRNIMRALAEIGPSGHFLIAIIEDIMRRADKAVIDQDVVGMVAVFKEMQEVKE